MDADKSLKIGIITEEEHAEFMDFTQKWFNAPEDINIEDQAPESNADSEAGKSEIKIYIQQAFMPPNITYIF